jgi:hypothetical protein
MYIDYCPACQRDIHYQEEPPFDMRKDNHVERCIERSKVYKKEQTYEAASSCPKWGRILEQRRRRKNKPAYNIRPHINIDYDYQ